MNFFSFATKKILWHLLIEQENFMDIFCFDFDIYLFFCSFEFRLYFSEVVKLLKVLLMCCLSTNSSHLVIGVRIVVVAYIRCCNSHTLSSKCHAMPVVNFINILHANFMSKSLFCSFFYLHVTRESCRKDVHTKNLCIKCWWNWHLVQYLDFGLQPH
jgi:hypothetical protein